MGTHRMARLLIVSALMANSFPAHAAAPAEINYQGKLADSSGNPLTNNFSIRFRVCGSPDGADCGYYDRTFPAVPVTNGVFNVVITPPASAFQGGTERYLMVSVNGTDLSPRQKLVASPYALAVAEGSVGTNELADDAVTSAKAGFPYAGSSSKGGPAAAIALSAPGQCAGTVSRWASGRTGTPNAA